MNRLIFRAFDGRQIRYDITGFEHGRHNEMAGVFIDGDYYKIVENIDKEDNSFYLPAVVDQFTGILDKNNVEIFERDIVKWGENIETVSFYDGCFQTETSIADAWMEVVGNIHQNPELLIRG